MEKKLLSVFFALSLFFLNPFSGFGQDCPTSVTLTSDPGTNVCEGTPITFTANITAGSGLSYQWEIGGSIVGTDQSYTLNDPQQGQQVKVTVSSSGTSCTSRTSSSLIVNTLKTPTVEITPTKSTICPGENVSFSASPTNQGSTPTYEWFINGTPVQNGSSSKLNNPSELSQGQNTVRVVLKSSLTCVTAEEAEKTINYTVKPIATIAATTSTNSESCINTAITPIKFDIGGGGSGATVSGLPTGISGSFLNGVYTISGSPTTSGIFDFTVNTTGTCEQTSATGFIKINPNATLSLTSGNNNQTVCAAGGVGGGSIESITYSIGETGTDATVSILPTGITGTYSNGVLTISGSSSEVGSHNFTVTAKGSCGNSSTLNGSITITGNVEPSVSISSSDPDNEICEGAPVTFTATPTNGGSSPSYQWLVDGNNVGSGGNTFTTSSLEDGQTVTVILTSNETCRTEDTATIKGITTKVNPNLEPSVTIDPSDTDFCAGDEVIYTAVPVNGGLSPTYQWKVGSTVVGSGDTFTSSSLTNGQSITVTLTSSETCVTSTTAVSEPVITSVNENLVPSVSIVSDDPNNIICSGNSITFTATTNNEGTAPEYQWQINGVASGNPTSSKTFSPPSPLTDGDEVSVVLTSNEECLAENNVTSNEIAIQVDQDISSAVLAWDNTNLSHNPTAICPSVSGLKYKVVTITGATSYDWSLPPSGWSITNGQGTDEITVTANVNATAGNITVNGRSECGPSQSISLAVTTGTAAHVGAGPDQTVCPGTTEINLNGEIGGVITQKKDWNWSDNGAGGTFKNNQGSDLKGTYTIPSSLRNGGTITIRIQSVKPAGNCDIKTDEMTLTIQSAAAITDPTNKNQTVCINSEIASIPFTISGAGTGATVTGLPSGVTGTFANGIFTLTGTPTEFGTFNYTVTTTGNCINKSITGTLTVNPRPTFTQPEEVFVCAGAETSTITFTGSSVTGTTYGWVNDNTSIGLAASGTGNIGGFTAVNTTSEPVTANITVTPIANNCEGTSQEFQITVYPTATFTTPEDISVCNGENLGDIVFAGSNVAGTTYKWSNTNPSIGLAAEGTGNISSFSAINTTNAPIEATITVTPVANGCDGTPEEFTITVNPIPAFTAPENIIICNGETFSQFDFTGVTVTGTTFSWTNNKPSIGLATSGTGNLPSFAAENGGNEPISATISVIPRANNCEGEPVTFEITVNPTAEVNNIEDVVICNGEDFSEIVLSSNVTGTSYSWTNSNTEIGLAGSGTGNIPAFTAENGTNDPLTSTITITPTANECEGTPYTFEITVNPSSIVDVGSDQTICSNGVATMAAILGGGASEGTWTTSGSGSFSNNSINAEYTPSDSDVLNGSVILTYTSNDPEGPCGATSDTMELFINEEVVITTEPQNIGVCSTEPSQLTVIASGNNLTYVWKRTDGENIVNSNGIYSSTLSFNNTTSVNAGEYYVVVKGEVACNDDLNPVESARVTINVDENIIIEEPQFPVPICGDGFSEVTMKFIAHANGAPLTFTWYKDNVEIDANSDSNITITTGSPDGDGKYEGTLHLANITTDYNGDYYVEISGPVEFTCSTAVTNPFQLRLNEMPELPKIEDLVVCQYETPEAFSVTTGTNLRWYLNEDDTDFIKNGSGQPITPVPGTNESGDFYYWVTQKPEACESEKVQVKVTVNEKPEPPTTEKTDIDYCESEDDTAYTFDILGSNLTWYSDASLQNVISEPVINTANVGTNSYWVSQTSTDGCESDRLQVSVNVNPLPELTVDADDSTICSGTSTTLTASGAASYNWVVKGTTVSLGTSATLLASPTSAAIYEVTGTSDKGCTSKAEVAIQVDQQSAGGVITPSATTVCVSGNSGTLSIAGSGYVGTIQRWESSGNNWSTKTDIANTSETLNFSNLIQNTKYRAVVKNGVCTEAYSQIIEIQVYPKPVGGELNFASNVGRILMICENEQGAYGEDLILSGFTGEIVSLQYRASSATSWNTMLLNISNPSMTGTVVLAASQLEGISINETTIFRVEIKSGPCLPNAFSKTAIVSVIPTDIEPTPVSVDPGVICLGEQVTLSSSTGYTNGQNIFSGGAFDNASITEHNWRVRRNGSPTDLGFDTDANNIITDRWKRATRHQFPIANISTPYSAPLKYISSQGPNASGNKGFGLITAQNPATLETPVFSIDGLDQALLVFDQFYNLTPGASIQVKISTDGGNSYPTTLYDRTAPSTDGDLGITSGYNDGFALGTISTRPENKIQIDLGNYMGQGNLRIMFSYVGTRNGDVWAIDNIDVPDGPRDVGIIWTDYSDSEKPDGDFIGNNDVEQWTPRFIGLNVFEVKTQLILNSKGASCEDIINAETVEVYVFDTYTSNATAVVGTCGNLDVQLTGTIEGTNANNVAADSVNPDGNFPLGDNSTAFWEVISGPAGYTYTFTPDMNANVTTFTPNLTGDYEIRYTITKDPNSPCTVTSGSITFTIPDCTTLDFDGIDDYVDLGTGYTASYSIEAWVRPESTNGTIISGPGYELSLVAGKPTFITSTGTIASPIGIAANSRWYHIAASSNGKLYVDGIEVASGLASTGGATVRTLIGARKNSGIPENYFSGWIAEVRIWDTAITQNQIRFMMNQHLIDNGAQMGEQIPMNVPDGLAFVNLAGYYRLISRNPDPLGLGAPWGVTFAAALMPANGLTPDLANTAVPGRLNNMTTDQENTAPMPYISANDGTWATVNTWLRPLVWDAPNSNGVTGAPIDWNIVRINHNINSGDRDITVLGLKSETAGKLLNITHSGTQDEYNRGQMLRVTHYLLLNGNIDLVGESQLLQDSGSILDEASAGYLERDQKGKRNSFVYNYWSSPVSKQGAANNATYNVFSVLMDGTTASNPQTIIFDARYWIADWGITSPITISTYWLWGYSPAEANIYAEWDHILENGTLKTGEGFTMKGTDGTASIGAEQNYTFRGKPHNGDFDLSMAAGQNYLIGNPYPSAVDADEFIRNNLNDVVGGTNGANVFDGALYFWDHFQKVDHILKEYIGGYATYNLSGGVPAISNDARINANDALGIKYPGRHIPVAQAFLINSSNVNAAGVTIIGGNIHFKNSQRIFKREQIDDSQFLKPEVTNKTNKQKTQEKSKIRISFKSPVGYHRQILVGAIPSTTNGFDLGYDALLFDDNVEDMYWMQADNQLVIQGVPNFDKDQVLPLGVKIKENKEFRIRIDTLENTPAEMKVYLNDKLKDSIHDLKAGAYISTSEPGYIHDRFEIIFFKEEPPVIEGPIVGEPGEEGPIIEDPETDFTTLSIKHAHNLREIQIMNPDRLIITSVYLFDLNGNLIEDYTNIPQNKEIKLKVGNYSSGVYLLKVYAEGKIISKKIIISN